MPIRIYNPGINADLRPTAVRTAFASDNAYNVNHHVSYSTLLSQNPKITKRTDGDLRAEVQLDPTQRARLQEEQHQKLVSGQRANFWRPYKPLGNMSSVLHLKVVLHKENHLTGERTKKQIGRKTARAVELEEEDEDEDLLDEKPSSAGSSRQAPLQQERNHARPLHRVLNLARSEAFKQIAARVKIGDKIKKFVAAGTPIEDHLTQRTAEETVDFAIQVVRGTPDKELILEELYDILLKYDYTIDTGGLGGSSMGDRKESNASLLSAVDGTNSVRGGSSVAGSQTSSRLPPRTSAAAATAAPPVPLHRASMKVSDKLAAALVPAFIAPTAPPQGRERKNTQHGGPNKARRQFLVHASSGMEKEDEEKPSPSPSRPKPVEADLGEDKPTPTAQLHSTLSKIFSDRADQSLYLGRDLDALSYSWPRRIQERSDEFKKEPPSLIPSMASGSLGPAVPILMSPRPFPSGSAEMAHNASTTHRSHLDLTRQTYLRNPWFLECLSLLRHTSRPPPPRAPVRRLHAANQPVHPNHPFDAAHYVVD